MPVPAIAETTGLIVTNLLLGAAVAVPLLVVLVVSLGSCLVRLFRGPRSDVEYVVIPGIGEIPVLKSPPS